MVGKTFFVLRAKGITTSIIRIKDATRRICPQISHHFTGEVTVSMSVREDNGTPPPGIISGTRTGKPVFEA
jgi:hypothetical protein